jgi:hypothetical protein
LVFAALSIPHSYWANAYYHRQRERGCARQAALRALAFKWIRILYRCQQPGFVPDVRDDTKQRRSTTREFLHYYPCHDPKSPR